MDNKKVVEFSTKDNMVFRGELIHFGADGLSVNNVEQLVGKPIAKGVSPNNISIWFPMDEITGMSFNHALVNNYKE